MAYLGFVLALVGFIQLTAGASIEDKYEPMVAFICERPAMHRGVNSWISDKSTSCLDRMEDILSYCQKMYPDHNISNVVEASYLVTIPDWPLLNSGRTTPHRVRPFRCLVGGFQSDALLVPQHCEFDHRHDQSVCEGFSHWNVVADDACRMKGAHLESFGMLLNCKLGKFSGVEYVCCPNKLPTPPNYHPPQEDDSPDSWYDDHSSDSSDEDTTSTSSSSSVEKDNENVINLYEAYLRDKEFPPEYDNEHKKFLAAKKWMKEEQQRRMTKLLQEWQAAREHVDEVRKTDIHTADRLSDEITARFQNLYSAYEQENQNELDQLVALHLQRVQALLNDRKRETMDKYLRALDDGDEEEIIHQLRNYIKAEEKDRMHTVNHYEHVRFNSAREALRIHPFIVNHLRLTEKRIDQALDMLTRYPDVEVKIRPEIEEFLARFNSIAESIRDVVLPLPEVEEDEVVTSSNSAPESDSAPASSVSDSDSVSTDNDDFDLPSSVSSSNSEDNSVPDEEDDEEEEEEREDEHDYERSNGYARRMDNSHSVRQSVRSQSVRSAQVSSTIGFALGGISLFVIIMVAIVMVIRRRNNTQFVSHSYVEVDPSASPEERHVANMQMNGYENPTYMYFETQPQNPKA